MQVSIETLKGLERKMTISIPTKQVEEEVSLGLKNLTPKVKIDGFRPGKAPLSIVKRRFSQSVLAEASEKFAKEAFTKTLEEHKLELASPASFDLEQMELGKDVIAVFTFEVTPDINLSELNKTEIEVIKAELTAHDIDKMLEKLQKQEREWKEVSRPSKSGDKIIIDADGYINDEPFEGGKLENQEIIIGESNMLPDFEKGLIGQEKDQSFVIDLTFPEDYYPELAKKEAQFKGTVKKVLEPRLMPLDDSFAEKFNIKEGGITALKADLEKHMRHALESKVGSVNRSRIFNALLAENTVEVPNYLLEHEIHNLKHAMYHQIFGNHHDDNEVIPDFPRELFEDKAKQQVALRLIFQEYIKKHGIVADKKRIKAKINSLADVYEDPEDFFSMLEENKNERANIENLVLEEMIADKIAEHAKLIEKQMDYDSAMNYQEKGEKESEGEETEEEKGGTGIKSKKNPKKVKEVKLDEE